MAKITSKEAYLLAKKAGVNFNKDFHEQSKGSELSSIANLTGYKKPKNGKYSTGKYFFEYLSRLKKKNRW